MDYEAVFLGLVAALLFTGLTGYYPGGMIVPGYLALFIGQPLRIAATWSAALLTWGAYRLISRHLILFGRRRFVFMILMGGTWTFLWILLFPRLFPLSPEWRIIGWVIPGLLANHFERQGLWITTAAAVIVTTAVYFLTRALLIISG